MCIDIVALSVCAIGLRVHATETTQDAPKADQESWSLATVLCSLVKYHGWGHSTGWFRHRGAKGGITVCQTSRIQVQWGLVVNDSD